MSPQLIAASNSTDPLCAATTVFPLGRPFGQVDEPTATPTIGRPFGLRYAVAPTNPVPVDLSGLRYDADRQLSVDSAGVPVYDKHSTGPTGTQTSDGHKSMDSDVDHTED